MRFREFKQLRREYEWLQFLLEEERYGDAILHVLEALAIVAFVAVTMPIWLAFGLVALPLVGLAELHRRHLAKKGDDRND